MIKSQTSKLSNFSISPLPIDPFKSLPLVITQKRKICNLQSNKFKHSPKEKNCKKLDEVSMASHKNVGKNTRDNESCRKNIGHLYSPSTSQQNWSVDRTFIEENTEENDLMASPPMFSPIKSGLKRSIFDMTPQKPVKNVAVRKLFPSTQYNSNTSKIGSEAIANYLMATPSKLNDSPIISLTGLFQSTPESAHKNVTPVADSQLMSSTTQSETFSKDSEANVNHGCILKFITSTLPQLNTKLNKIILNQSKHEELLKKILQNKTVHDESFYDNTDLEEFPLHNLDSLKEIDGKLKSDTLFYKCLVKRLKEFGGNNVYMVTKCIMDFLMTDNLGMQISLTGRGTNNKKNEKMSLISLTMFKLITRVILKNVSGSTITSINKAVTGWLKHAKERNGRRESL
ncbi:uncharacterized protein LOC132951247 isoform X2 [Metopolophium dirhodum]|nr:uncharacterized protein LOC132951247 isoform X2 [Metopolophium dirhodum]